MYQKFKKLGALTVSFAMILGTMATIPVYAKQDNIEIVLTDVTKNDETTLLGEAKIKVGVKGAGGKVNAVQTALKFSGDMKYKSIEYLVGENNPPKCFWIPPNAAMVNSTKTILPGLATNGEGMLTFTDDETDLFVITFYGDAGDEVTVSLNNESAAGTYCSVDGEFIETAEDAEVSRTAEASDEDNEGILATVKLVMNKITDFMVSDKEGYADSKITLTITNEETDSTINTVLNTVLDKKGGHFDGSSSEPTFIVKNTVIAGDTYTLELSGPGYITYRQSGVDFSKVIEITNDEGQFTPGDVNSDGKIDELDKEAFLEVKGGNYDNYPKDYADFNRDGNVDDFDDIFDELTEQKEPEKMSKPKVTGGEKKITVEWDKPEDDSVTGYIIKYGKNENVLPNEIEITGADKKKKEISNLSENTTYYVAIAAVNEAGEGKFSDTASAKTNKKDPEEGSGGGGTGGSGGGGAGGGGMPAAPGTNAGTNQGTGTTDDNNEIFVDLTNYAWAKDYIYKLYNAGIVSGTSDTTYSPANNIKRGDFILILTRMLKINNEFLENFSDVPVGSYYYNAIGSAKAAGIAKGSGDEFMPESTITRQDLITLAYRAFLNAGYIEETQDLAALDNFNDSNSISDYAKAPMASMVSAGIIKGSDGGVNPLGYATRAEVAVMCARLYELMK